jgi:putative endonuclease
MPPLSTAMEIGNYGERVAAAFVRRRGYKILTRNFKTSGGEIDLICRDKETLVFVEVRSRSEDAWVRGAETIDERKENALRYTARRYLELLERDDVPHRFDAVEVELKAGKIPICVLFPGYL